MKKLIAVAAGALLCGAFALSACGGKNPEGQIEGKYVEVTGAALTEKLKDVTAEKLFGDASSKNWEFGFEFTSALDLETDVNTADADKTERLLKLDLEEKSNLKTVLTSTEAQTKLGGLSLKAQNTNTLKGKLWKSDRLGIAEDKEFEYSINLHADDEYLYFQIPDVSDLPLPFEVAAGKFKTPIEYVFSAVAGALPNSLAKAAEGDGSAAADLLEEYNLKAYVDESDGLKIKISATEQSLYSALEKFANLPEERAKSFATFNSFAVDLYFETAENGKFERAGIVADINGSLNVAAGALADGLPALNGTVNFKADMALKRFSGKINLPAPEELEKYVDITAENG